MQVSTLLSAALLALLLAGCATAPRGPDDSTTTLVIAGETHRAHWLLPAGEPLALVLLQPGFSRRCEHLRSAARQVRDQGLAVLCIEASMAQGNPALADALAATLATGLPLPGGGAMPARIIVGGHSAGAAFAARVGARLDQLAPQRLAGALLLDPVAVPGFSDHLRTLSRRGERPVLALRANAGECNARHSASAALHQLQREAAPGRNFVGLQLTEGSTHIDVEGEDSDAIARLACGQPLPANIVRVRTLAADWALQMARGETPQPPAAMTGLKLVD